MKKFLFAVFSLAFVLCAAELGGSGLSFDPMASVTIQAQKDLYDNDRTDNLDNWFGRLDLGGRLEKGSSYLEVDLRFYPEGFGYNLRGPKIEREEVWDVFVDWVFKGYDDEGNPIIEIVEDSTLIDTLIEVDYTNMQEHELERTRINRAVFGYEGDMLNLRIGRDFLWRTEGNFYGNYINTGITSTQFFNEGVPGNFLEFERVMDIASLVVMLESTSSNLNSGNLMTWLSIDPVPMFSLGVGYKSNVFDLINDDDANVVHALALNTMYSTPSDFEVFAELGVRDISSERDAFAPVLVGARYPLAGVFEYIQVETELLKTGDREKLTGVEENPVLYGISSVVELSDHMNLDLGLFTTRDASEPTLGVEFHGGF